MEGAGSCFLVQLSLSNFLAVEKAFGGEYVRCAGFLQDAYSVQICQMGR